MKMVYYVMKIIKRVPMALITEIAPTKDFIVSTLRFTADIANAIAPPLAQHIRDAVDYIDGTVSGVEKPLAERWKEAIFTQARLEGEEPAAIMKTRSGLNYLGLIHQELLDEAKKKQSMGISRLAAQEAVIERRETHFGAIAHLVR